MGIYNRDYYREMNSNRGGWLEGLPVIKFLILTNIAVFLLQLVVVREVRLSPLETMRKYSPQLDRLLTEKEEDPEALEEFKKEHPELFAEKKDLYSLMHPTQKVSIVQEWFELDTRKVVRGGQVWRLLTHAFCHDRYSVWHIFFNMLCLYWFGCALESMYGSREFLLFYLTAAVVAGLAFVGLDLYTGSNIPGIGASGAVMAVMMLFTMHFPRETICIFWFLPIEMRWLMVFYLIWDLHPVLLALSGDHFFTGIAHAAHLGGLVFGFLYAKYEWRLDPLLDHLPAMSWRSKPRLRLHRAPAEEHEAILDPEMDRVDDVLQKICESGQASLTEEELAILRSASDRLKRRGGRAE